MTEAELIGVALQAVDGLVALAIALYYNRDLRIQRDQLQSFLFRQIDPNYKQEIEGD